MAENGPKPLLAVFFETAAEAMDLTDGHQRLELMFENGHLRVWTAHSEKNGAYALERFDAAIDWRAFALPLSAEDHPLK
jgi:hypothetical protein